MTLSSWPDKFTAPDPNENEYIEIHFDKEMVYDQKKSTTLAICIREKGKFKDLEWIPVSMLRKVKQANGSFLPEFPKVYFNSIWINVKLAEIRHYT